MALKDYVDQAAHLFNARNRVSLEHLLRVSLFGASIFAFAYYGDYLAANT
jgi:hypothetical protein